MRFGRNPKIFRHPSGSQPNQWAGNCRRAALRLAAGLVTVVAFTATGAVGFAADHNSHSSVAAVESTGHRASSQQAQPARNAHGKAHWTYKGTTGPESWGRLARDFHLCEQGRMQSPINIDAGKAEAARVQPIRFDYRPVPLDIVNNGHTVQVNYQPGSSITIGNKRYDLLQFHFHTPSEHAVGGARSPLEVHFVHKSQSGELAVIGVLLDNGEENIVLREIWNYLPAHQGPAKSHEMVVINARDLLPVSSGYFRYMGSLTTPPCSEGVNWYVMETKSTVAPNQVSKFERAVGLNARPLQALNNRMLIAPVKAD